MTIFKNMHNNHHYNKRLKANARALRKDMTKAEACLWKYVLSRKRIKGFQFRRQRPIGQYIVDFVCLPLKLVIEVDGITHTYGETILYDEHRQKKLEALGFVVLRFTDDDVLSAINDVYREIELTVDDLVKQLGP
jgi:very-short-patch-repair endonuclease